MRNLSRCDSFVDLLKKTRHSSMPLLSPRKTKALLPLKEEAFISIEKFRNDITALITGLDSRLALVVGPCSLHDIDSALEYARKLKVLQEQVKKTCFLVMRAHVEKPRTCLGWKGLLHDPYLNGQPDISHGLFISRQILLELANLHIPLATEFLDPIASNYFSDLISWGFIGARTSSSQIHRQLASSSLMPIGFKNSIDGNLESAIHGVLAAERSHSFLNIDNEGYVQEIKSLGNPFCHIVLRGSDKRTNYDPGDIQLATHLCKEHGVNSRILIDCSHGNSQKNHLRQEEAFFSTIRQYVLGNKNILGSMIESHLEEGNQPFESLSLNPSISLTDPCINWDTTERLILSAHEELSESLLSSSSSL